MNKPLFITCFLLLALCFGAAGQCSERENGQGRAPLSGEIAFSRGGGMEKKIDPFASPLKESEPVSAPPGHAVLRETLEKPKKYTKKKFSDDAYIDSFRLAGLIMPENGSAAERLAMIEDLSGRGQMLREGMSIGLGRVAAILEDRIVIEIGPKGARGRRYLRRKELVLKKSGELMNGAK